MNGAFYIAATGLEAQQRALDVVANNIANINTPGFKRSEVRFSELVAASGAGDSTSASSVEGALMNGVSATNSPRVFDQGALQQTGNPLDLAISGAGFVELLGPAGQTMLWRGGTLSVNRDGLLAGANGLVLKDSITVPDGATGLNIAQDGTVSAMLAGETQATEIGHIGLVKVRDTTALTAADGGLYRTDAADDVASVDPGNEGAGTFVQGSLEGSNVELSQEMVALLVMQRAYAANAQIVQAGDQLMAIANGLKR
jgi:flagellar basal-body rod protein FlgG